MRTLLTRDGRQIGNAIIVEEIENKHGPEKLFLVETDFGNRCKLNQAEIEAWFYPGREASYAEWSTDRTNVRFHNCDEPDDGSAPAEHGFGIPGAN
jgi:hypothetical protein